MEKPLIRILYLDDEIENLIGFKANFRRHYEIHTAISTGEALSILDQYEIHLVLIDQGMPDVSGLEFLQLIAEDFPLMMKILVTGHIDLGSSLEKAIGTANIYRCISKPWTENDMRIAIEDAYKIYCFKKAKDKELQVFKNELSYILKAPIANLEGLLTLARIEIKDEYALHDYFDYMNKSIETIKSKLDIMLRSQLLEESEHF